MKPILFNTEMVRALLDGRKTCTRRVVKPQPPASANLSTDPPFLCAYDDSSVDYGPDGRRVYMKPYLPGDILYVRETWCSAYDGERYFYLSDKHTDREEKQLLDYNDVKWRPSIHMPKEAARLFLRVTDVRVERLQDITEDGARSEGCFYGPLLDGCDDFMVPALYSFQSVWDSTVRKTNRDTYGWDANPWVWAIEFERCEKPEEADHEE